LTKIDVPSFGKLQGIALARSVSEVWLNAEADNGIVVLRFDGERYTRIDVRGPRGMTRGRFEARTVVTRGDQAWMFAGDTIWQLLPPKSESPRRVKIYAKEMGKVTVEPVVAGKPLGF
jgi:hypothetical protein